MHINSKSYRKAFQAYLRKGTPIERYIKQKRTTTHYIWRTRGDDKVRPSHAANNGRVFSWNDPPETGHPGEDYGCPCTAEPLLPSVDVGMEVVDLGETIYENIHRPLEDYLRGRVGLHPTGPRRLGIHTGEPYSITDRWTGSFSGRVFADPTRSRFA